MAKHKERKAPRPGAQFSKIHKGKTYFMEIVSQGGGTGYKVGQNVYNSPSGAAKSITKTDINGWEFWGLDK